MRTFAPSETASFPMRLLVIEDEPKLADYLHKGLSENGYVVDVARATRQSPGKSSSRSTAQS